MKRFAALLLALLSVSVFAQQNQKLSNGKWAYYGEEFYLNLDANRKLDRAIFKKIFNENHSSVKGSFDSISSQCQKGNCYRHTSVGYDQARKIMFGELDTLRDSNGTYVLDVYCGKKFYFRSLDEVSGMHERVNIEHKWPQSRFNGSISKDQQKSDMHHLYLSDSLANSTRGNSPFGFVTQAEDRFSGEGCKSRYGFKDNSEVYTPPPSHRGNIARALFYFSLHNNLPISQSEETVLRQWHKVDPIDENEIKRHEGIAKHQFVRNPFVDHPHLVDHISDF